MYAIHGRWDAGHSKTSWLNGLSLIYVLVFNLVMSWQRSKKLQETNETCMHSHSFSHLRPIKPSVVSLARSSALSTDQRVSFHMTSYHISFSTGCFYYLGPEPCQCPHEICSGTFILGRRLFPLVEVSAQTASRRRKCSDMLSNFLIHWISNVFVCYLHRAFETNLLDSGTVFLLFSKQYS